MSTDTYRALKHHRAALSERLRDCMYAIDRIVDSGEDDEFTGPAIAAVQADMEALYAARDGIDAVIARDYLEHAELDREVAAERRHEELTLGNSDYL